MKRIAGLIAAAAVLGLSACGPSSEERTVGPVTVSTPEGWVQSQTYEADDYWSTAFVDQEDEPTAQLRVSPELGTSSHADSAANVLEGVARVRGVYGPEFAVENKEIIDIDGADQGFEVRFTYAAGDGTPMTGIWWTMSDRETGFAAGVELSGQQVSDELANQIRDSIRLDPDEREAGQ